MFCRLTLKWVLVIWVSITSTRLNSLWQMRHGYCLFWWVVRWRFNRLLYRNDLEQNWQLNGFFDEMLSLFDSDLKSIFDDVNVSLLSSFECNSNDFVFWGNWQLKEDIFVSQLMLLLSSKPSFCSKMFIFSDVLSSFGCCWVSSTPPNKIFSLNPKLSSSNPG